MNMIIKRRMLLTLSAEAALLLLASPAISRLIWRGHA